MGEKMSIIEIIELLGTVAFAVSGVLVAIKNEYDLFGICVLGCVTAVGGGIMRDVILGNVPPFAFVEPIFFGVAVISSLISGVIIKHFSKKEYKSETAIKLFLLIDAVGLAMFTVSGVNVAIAFGHINNGFLATFVGVLTGVGGGVLRDVLAGIKPMLFRKQVYGVASALGAILYFVLLHSNINSNTSMILSLIIIIGLRLLSIKYHWNLPTMS